MNTRDFSIRQIGPTEQEQKDMLKEMGLENLDSLIQESIPKDIQLTEELNLEEGISEHEMLNKSHQLMMQNELTQNYIGMGYYPCVTPSVIQRNIFENPGWYTAYTPYQAEISQGRLEALLNFQTMICDLTGFEMANASLLDEGTAAAEAMHMLYGNRSKEQKSADANTFFVSDLVFPQTIAVLRTKADSLGIQLKIGNYQTEDLGKECFGALLQYPGKDGFIQDYSETIQKYKQKDIKTVMACDLMALVLLKTPAEMGADIAVGTTQRFGIPMGFGGPHAAYFACNEEYKRSIPGRIIGVSEDEQGQPALRMALQTREQHIKREKATSNICTAQVLLAVMAGMYAVYHGKEGLIQIASEIHEKTSLLHQALKSLNIEVEDGNYFDTIKMKIADKKSFQKIFESKNILFNYYYEDYVCISLHERVTDDDFKHLIQAFEEFTGNQLGLYPSIALSIPEHLKRKSDFLTHDVFKKFHTETELMRYIKRLERKDLSLTQSMIPLGSCTMKLNAATELMPLSWPHWGDIHPFAPTHLTQGYNSMIQELERDLSIITGFSACSLQPNSGAQGEYAGLVVINEYHKSKNEGHRNIVLIPQSAHGTNPASAVIAGMKVVVVKNLDNGEFDLKDLEEKAVEHKEHLAAIMITYPSTYGFFDKNIKKVTKIIHDNGGQVYLDGANMNAQVGLSNPAIIGADVCHLNLHKTFAIPHGGGGPGVGPICVAKHLEAFLPTTSIEDDGVRISSSNYGSAFILNISYSYIKMLGKQGLKQCSKVAILSANYLKTQLEKEYDILYANENGRVAHELIVDFRKFKELGIEVTDIAKRLMDFGFHAPTVSFPVAGTLMIEPTESENKEELDRFIAALIQIKKEIDAIANGEMDVESNTLKNAPHTLDIVTSDNWDYSYTREQAAFPLEWVRERKFFASVSRIKEAQGDRNLICTCNPIEDYV